MAQVSSFEDLTVWQKSQDLAVEIYRATKTFPKDEVFAITSQLRRSASSISANIAEGFGRESKKDKLHFYTIAYGSILETKNFLYLAKRLGYIEENKLEELLVLSLDCQKLLNALKTSLRRTT